MRHKINRLAFYGIAAALCTASFCSTAGEKDAILMKIATIQGNPASGQIVVILTEADGDRLLPIVVGSDQALAIHLGHQGMAAPRPLTHDLMANVLKAVKAEVERVVITDLREGTYYAEITLRQGGETHVIDARPSDAIALSLRVKAPIYAMPLLLASVPDLSFGEEGPAQSESQIWGLTVQALTPELAQYFGRKEGVLISDVKAGGPADRQGLQPGDLVLRIDDAGIRDVKTFLQSLATRESAQSLVMDYLRAGKDHKATLTRKE